MNPSAIACPECEKFGALVLANRVGAQDGCDVYLCTAEPHAHLVRIPVDTPRAPWPQ